MFFIRWKSGNQIFHEPAKSQLRGGASGGKPGLGWQWSWLFHHLPCPYCHIFIFPSRIQLTVEQPKTKSTQPKSAPRCPTPRCTFWREIWIDVSYFHFQSPEIYLKRGREDFDPTLRLDRLLKRKAVCWHDNRILMAFVGDWPCGEKIVIFIDMTVKKLLG